jgi:hypothetical protein
MQLLRPLAIGLTLASALAAACANQASSTSDDTASTVSAIERKAAACSERFAACDAGAADCDQALDTCSDEAVKGAGERALAVGFCTDNLRACLKSDTGSAAACIPPFHACMAALKATRDAGLVADHDADSDEDTASDEDRVDVDADAGSYANDAAIPDDADMDEDSDEDMVSDEGDAGKPDGAVPPGQAKKDASTVNSDAGCKKPGKGCSP